MGENSRPALAGVFLNRTAAVGSYAPNAWGLYDMHGNVAEYCSAWPDADRLPGGTVTDPTGFTSFTRRGGGFALYFEGSWCRSADRHARTGGDPSEDTGFRTVLVPVP